MMTVAQSRWSDYAKRTIEDTVTDAILRTGKAKASSRTWSTLILQKSFSPTVLSLGMPASDETVAKPALKRGRYNVSRRNPRNKYSPFEVAPRSCMRGESAEDITCMIDEILDEEIPLIYRALTLYQLQMAIQFCCGHAKHATNSKSDNIHFITDKRVMDAVEMHCRFKLLESRDKRLRGPRDMRGMYAVTFEQPLGEVRDFRGALTEGELAQLCERRCRLIQQYARIVEFSVRFEPIPHFPGVFGSFARAADTIDLDELTPKIFRNFRSLQEIRKNRNNLHPISVFCYIMYYVEGGSVLVPPRIDAPNFVDRLVDKIWNDDVLPSVLGFYEPIRLRLVNQQYVLPALKPKPPIEPKNFQPQTLPNDVLDVIFVRHRKNKQQ